MNRRRLTLAEALAPAPVPRAEIKHTHPPHLRDFSFNNYTGHVLTARGLTMCLEAVFDLHLTKRKFFVVRNVPCMKDVSISVQVDQHGNARLA